MSLYTFAPYVVEATRGEGADGDWIVTDVNGERRPVTPSVFDMNYEPVDGPETTPNQEEPS